MYRQFYASLEMGRMLSRKSYHYELCPKESHCVNPIFKGYVYGIINHPINGIINTPHCCVFVCGGYAVNLLVVRIVSL